MTLTLDRRGLLRTGAAAAVLSATGLPLAAAPKRGGSVRIGLAGANSSDSWDGRTHADTYIICLGMGAVFDCLTEVAPDGSLRGELATSWEASADAKEWVFNLRKGVHFHNGQAFTADDVIASLKLHTAEDSKSGAKPIVAAIEEMEKITDHQIRFVLSSGNADFPHLMSDFHLLIYPAGDIEGAIAKGIGTGGYQVVSFDPGVRTVLKKFDGHYKDDACWFDEVEVLAINDVGARMNALMTGQVDAINRVDFKTEALLKRNPRIALFEVTGNQHYTFPMQVAQAPFGDVNVRRALKYGVNREEMLAKILQGHGRVGNDHPIGPANQYFAEDLPQTSYDPDKAAFYLKQAGLSDLTVKLSASDAAFAGAVDAAQLYQASAAKGGIQIEVVREPSDGYWSNVWLKKAWCACYWAGRATEDWIFSSAYERGVPWNDTGWDNERFQMLLLAGRTELDTTKRREIYHEMQAIMSDEGATVVPMYANYVDAASTRLAHGPTIGNIWQMDGSRFLERWWVA